MTNTPDNIRNMWEQAAGNNEANKDLAALEKRVKTTGKQWGEKSGTTDPNNPSAAEKRFRAAQKALADAKAKEAALIKSSADKFAAERDARRASGTYES